MIKLSTLVDSSLLEERLQIMAEHSKRLQTYSAFYHGLKEQVASEKTYAARLSKQLGEKAIDAERSLRIVLKENLDTLNECIDSGAMEAAIGKAIKNPASSGIEDLKRAVDIAKDAFRERYPKMSLAFLDEATRLLEQYQTRISVKKGKLRIKVAISATQGREFFVEAKPSSGHRGRAGSGDFFRPIKSQGVALSRRLSASDKGPIALDTYGSLVSALAFAKKTMYRHVRQVNEVGLSRFSGSEIISLILLIGAIVAGGLILSGAIITSGCDEGWWSGDVCTVGDALMLAGVILACVFMAILIAEAGGTWTIGLSGVEGAFSLEWE